MRKGLWVLAAIGFGGVLLLAVVAQSTLRSRGGIEEARDLQELLRGSHASLLAADPPLRVYRVPRSEAWPGWRWKVEATLAARKRPDSPEVVRAMDRIVFRALATPAGGSPPSGLMLLVHVPGGADLVRLYDAEGRPVPRAPGSPPR